MGELELGLVGVHFVDLQRYGLILPICLYRPSYMSDQLVLLVLTNSRSTYLVCKRLELS